MFAEDVELLPDEMFARMLDRRDAQPGRVRRSWRIDLFAAMAKGGRIGFEQIDWFNGGLFDDDAALPLTQDDIALMLQRAGWTGPRSTRRSSARCSSAASTRTSAASWVRTTPTATRS